jgi:uncharacterized membrane protein
MMGGNHPSMEVLLALAVAAFLAVVTVVIAMGARLGALRSTVNELTQRVQALERGGETSARSTPSATLATPPPLPVLPPLARRPPLPTRPQAASAKVAINWESILGVKFFAWIGGLALFLGVVFFIKYAFDRNLITPLMRIGLGATFGLVLVALGSLPALRRYRVPSQSVSLTGMVILYANIYAAHSFYGLISLTTSTVAMWFVTAGALSLASRLESPALAILAVVAGFLTPILLRTRAENAIGLFGYVTILLFAVALLAGRKRWTYLLVVAALGAIAIECLWACGFFGIVDPQNVRVTFLFIQALFLALTGAFVLTSLADAWTLVAAAATGFATIVVFQVDPEANLAAWDFGLSDLLLSGAGLLALAGLHREIRHLNTACATIVSGALGMTWLAEWRWWSEVFYGHQLDDAPLLVVPSLEHVAAYFAALFFLYATAPLVCGMKRIWPWIIAAVAGPLQFWFFHSSLTSAGAWGAARPPLPHELLWLMPVVFVLPPAGWILYLVKGERVQRESADLRLASQGATVLAFVSLIFPVQFEREWITLGWAMEGLALILLYHWIPNRRLRAAALIVFGTAFARLALNPAVLAYHHRTNILIFNWYLYVYGVAGLCLFFGARWFGLPQEKEYERRGPPLLYTFTAIVAFLLMNIEIADYFSIGPTLTFSFADNFARDMTYTIAWALFAFALLVLGVVREVRTVRFAAIGLLSLALLKLFLHDLDALGQLYRIGAFFGVAIIAIVASFIYQRFLAPKALSR